MKLTQEQINVIRAVPARARRRNRVELALTVTGATQVEIESATGITQSHISDIVRGKVTNVGLDTARKFADFFGCAIEDLFPARESQEIASVEQAFELVKS